MLCDTLGPGFLSGVERGTILCHLKDEGGGIKERLRYTARDLRQYIKEALQAAPKKGRKYLIDICTVAFSLKSVVLLLKERRSLG